MHIGLIIVIIVLVFWAQIAFFLKSAVSIKALKHLYPVVNTLAVITDNETQLIRVHSNKLSKEFASIIDATNAYLINNQGTTDFYIIQNLSERVSLSKEEEAASGISIPLYIGLMGTFAGVGVGLFSLNFIGILSEKGLNNFLWGVVIAMAGSFVGLIPINMRDGSLLCVGKGNDDWNQSAPHGAGRLMSRSEAKGRLSVAQFKEAMQGVYSTTISKSTLDEAPMAYKSMDEIVRHIGPTAEIVKVLKPVYNFKAGE